MVRHFLRLSDYTEEELLDLLDIADVLKREKKMGAARRPLEGRTLAMFFSKSSTRTRVSFEAGMTELGGHAIMLSQESSQVGRGEPERDTARVLSRYVDAVMIRTFSQESVEELAKWSTIPVINGLTDLLHPCQLMADLMTARERLGRIDRLKVAWIGDGNNMARSWVEAAMVLGFKLTLACPKGYEVEKDWIERANAGKGSVTVAPTPLEAARGANVVTTDVWASMGQESEKTARLQAFEGFTVDSGIMEAALPEAVFLHCLPAHRGEEVTDEVIESPRSAVWDEAENRLHVQKAILLKLLKPEMF